METYAYITNPYNGMKTLTDSVTGRNIVNQFNQFNQFNRTNTLKGGALIAGSIGAVLIVGGLFAYSMFFSVPSSDSRYKEDQKVLLFTSKTINNPNASNKDIQKSLEQCNTLIAYYDSMIVKINEDSRNIQYSTDKDSVDNKKKLEDYKKQLQYFSDKKKIITDNKKKLDEIKKKRTTMEFNYWYEDQYIKLYEYVKDSIVNQKYKTTEEWLKIARDLDVLYDKEKERRLKQKKKYDSDRYQQIKFLKKRGFTQVQIDTMTQEQRRLNITRSQTQRGFMPQQQGYYPGSQLSQYGQPLIPQVPLVPQRQTRQTNVERLRISLQKDLAKKAGRREIFMKQYTKISDDDFKAKISNIFFDLLQSYTANESFDENKIHTIIQKYTPSTAHNYFHPGEKAESEYTKRPQMAQAGNTYRKFLQKILRLFTFDQQSDTANPRNDMSDMINQLVTEAIQSGDIVFIPGRSARGGAMSRVFNKAELTDNIAFDKEFIQNLPKKYIQIIDNMYANIEKRYILLAENIFKKHFINRKTAIKEEELINILQPIIVEKAI